MPDKTVRDIMAKNPVTLRSDETLDLARDIMSLGRIRHFPVVDRDKLVGVVSQRDLYRMALGSTMRNNEKAQRAFFKTVAVKEAMSHMPITIAADASIKDAARVMIDKKIGCLPVLEAEKLIGLVTETDLLKELLQM